MYKFLTRPAFQFFLIIIIGLIPAIPLMRAGFFPMQDDLQAFRIHQLKQCLLDLQIPCRWVPDMGYQFGYPQFNYYPASIYYLGALINLLGFQIIDAVKILFILGFVFSSLTMYLFLKDFLTSIKGKSDLFVKISSIVGVVLYTYLPYKATEVYVRGAMSEFWSFVFFPLLFWSSFKLIATNRNKYLCFLALSVGLLLLTHNLMSLIFLPVFAIWVLTLSLWEKKWSAILKTTAGVFLGLGLAAFFTIPVIFESKYVHLESLLGGYFDYRQHFVNLYQLFLSNHFGYGSSYLGPNDDLSLSVGQAHWVLGLLAVVLAIILFKKIKKIALIIIVLAVIELLVLFLMHQKSSFIWEKIPMLVWLQFPWRFLSVSGFLLSFLGSLAIYLVLLLNKKTGIVLAAVVVIGILIFHQSFFQPKEWFDITDQEKFTGKLWEKQLTISIFDYLPIYAKFPPTYKASELPEVLEGQVEFLNYKKGSNYQIGEFIAKQQSILRLPLFDFPGMKVFIDENAVEHNHIDCRNQQFCLGLITVQVPQGRHMIKVQLTDTSIRKTGNIITLVSILIIVLVFIKDKRKDEKLSI